MANVSVNTVQILGESRISEAYMRIFDRSTDDKFKLVIETNVLKKYKFSVKAEGVKIIVTAQFDEQFSGCVNSIRMALEHVLPQGVDAESVKTVENEKDQTLEIEAPRTKVKQS